MNNEFTSPLKESWNARENDGISRYITVVNIRNDEITDYPKWSKNKEKKDWYRLYSRQQEDVYEPFFNVWTRHYYLFELS